MGGDVQSAAAASATYNAREPDGGQEGVRGRLMAGRKVGRPARAAEAAGVVSLGAPMAAQQQQSAGEPWSPPVRIVASPQRHRTVSARMVDGVLELRVPASMPVAERERWLERMRARLERQLRRARPSDAALEERARVLNRRHFGGRLRWNSIAYAEQTSRWGSCAWATGVIRISTRAAHVPLWVLDYLLVHELAHLEVPHHGPRFWALANRYPLTERARGYLMALDHQAGRPEDETPED